MISPLLALHLCCNIPLNVGLTKGFDICKAIEKENTSQRLVADRRRRKQTPEPRQNILRANVLGEYQEEPQKETLSIVGEDATAAAVVHGLLKAHRKASQSRLRRFDETSLRQSLCPWTA